MSLLAAAGLGAGASLLSGGISSIFGGNQASKTRKANMRMAKWQHQQDVDMWHKSNAYNSPEQQMARLKKAGLNPNLAYGSGSVAGNTSTQTPKQSVPDMSARPSLDVDVPNPMQMLNLYQDTENKKVQTDNLKKQTELMTKESEIKSLQQIKMMAQTAKDKQTVKHLDALFGNTLEKLSQEVMQGKLKTNMMAKDWKNYNEHGIRPTDSIMYRGAANLYDQFKEWMKRSPKKKHSFNNHFQNK